MRYIEQYLKEIAPKLENIGDAPELTSLLAEMIVSSSRVATKVVATNDSSDQSKQAADYVCDGANDQVQIQQAINALPSGGGKVVLMEGTYLLDAATDFYTAGSKTSLVIDKNNLVLEGQGGTVLKLNEIDVGGGAFVATIYINAEHIAIHNLHFNNNRDNVTAFFNQAIWMGSASRFVDVSENQFENSKSYAIYGDGGALNWDIHHNTFANGYNGIGFHNCASNSHIHHNTLGTTSQSLFVGIFLDSVEHVIVSENYMQQVNSGIYVYDSVDDCLLINNIIDGYGASSEGIDFLSKGEPASTCHRNVVIGNMLYGLPIGIRLGDSYISNTIVSGNFFNSVVTPISDNGANTKYFDSASDLFMDLVAASTNAVHAAITGTGAEQEITETITNPDVQRNVSITNSANSTGDVVITGIDAKGNSVTDAITIVTGGIAYGVVAFSTVSKITIPAGVANPDTITVGISDKLGISNIIYASGDVYKVKVNNADDPTIGTVNTTYGTVDCATINAADDITIWYKSNLNIIA